MKLFISVWAILCTLSFSLTHGSSLQLQIIHKTQTIHSDLTEFYFLIFSSLIHFSCPFPPNLYYAFMFFLLAHLKMKVIGKVLFFISPM